MCASIYSRRIPPRAGSRRQFVRDPRWARFIFARFRKCNVFHFMIYPRTKSSSPLSSPPCPSSPRRKPPFPLPPFVVHVLDTFSLLLLLFLPPCRRLLARTFIRTGFCTPESLDFGAFHALLRIVDLPPWKGVPS